MNTLLEGRPQIVVPVFGMHRCGTSMFTRMLNIMGVELGEPLQPPSFDNPKGFWENRFFQSANMRLLESVGCDVNGFDTGEALKKGSRRIKTAPLPKWMLPPIAEYTRGAFQNSHWGWKDPRTVITWPFWEKCLKQLGYKDIRPVVLLRHPQSCAKSLKRRGDFRGRALPPGMTVEDYVFGIWRAYYELIDAYLPRQALVLCQEDLLDAHKAEREMARLAAYLGVGAAWISPALATIDVTLISHKEQDPSKIGDEAVRQVYNTFVGRAEQQREGFNGASATTWPAGTPQSALKPGAFCIYIVSPDGYVHSHAFDEHALSLHYAFRELGYMAPVVRQPWEISGTPVVLGANLLPHTKGVHLPPQSILYNLEQILDGSPWLKPEYVALLRRYQVWDYSRHNMEALEAHGVEDIRLCPVGYVEALSCIPQVEEGQDIDVLFYGSLNQRRTAILDALKGRGLSVASFFGVYGIRRDRLVARAKIVINIHYYESKVMEIIRLGYLMANKKLIVSERGNDPAAESPFSEGVVFADYHDLVEACVTYVNDDDGRKRIAARGYDIFSTHRQSDFLKEALA